MTAPLFEDERERLVRSDGVTVIRRRAFARDFAAMYNLGEHAVFGGRTTRGKTTLSFDLLEFIATPEAPAFVAVSKPNDPVTARRGYELGYRRVSSWPPPPKVKEIRAFGGEKPSGYLVWPEFGDLNTDMERCAVLTEQLIMTEYSRGVNPKYAGGILVMDDTMIKAKMMGQDRNLVTILAMAGAMKLGLWSFVQKPTDSGRAATWAYEQSTHLFFTKGGDEQMKRRYREIIGEKGRVGVEIMDTLDSFQFLYYNRVEDYMCIVGAN